MPLQWCFTNEEAPFFGFRTNISYLVPGTLFYASCYSLFRSAAAVVFSTWIGGLVDRTQRLTTVRHSIAWQRIPVAMSCLLLVLLQSSQSKLLTLTCFAASVGLAGIEKLAFVANTVSIERDWLIFISDSLNLERQDLNSRMRRIDLTCKLFAPLSISLVDGYSTRVAIWVVFGQNAISVIFEYFAIAQVFSAVPGLGEGKEVGKGNVVEYSDTESSMGLGEEQASVPATGHYRCYDYVLDSLHPWKEYVLNPAFLASFSLSLLYLTVLSFASQMTTYLLTLGFTSIDISIMRLVAVVLELSATCAAPALMRKIGATRSGLWFVNEQFISVILAVGLFSCVNSQTKLAGAVLAVGVALSRIGLWGFDLSVQYLVQEDAPEASRGSFSAIEVALQNVFELASFTLTMIFHRPEEFKIPILVSTGAVSVSAACFAGFVRQKRGHLLHASRCFKREGKPKYHVLPTIEEELEELTSNG
ncbi:uncharacterized protein BDR25DRAFT_303629 [Lindgomyces ingoldianus]|uniref:Uncharacterized protein n=1 Tax=Lindgomyces ingoldianus TaxID=673940 RepID=A0ACB6QVS8_9PLEO|nr:uncharacterized protein BDR25DRAFT_303629 [Lindgomyces ingoldianus]KAF2471103.1 hypothetical protein BDR25DRAFT_303629 [Lindgomyces ingoldianus]